MKLYDVEILHTGRSLGADNRTESTRVRAESVEDARARAIRKLYGKRAGFHRDSGLPFGHYGQIVEPAYKNHGAMNCITGRVRIDVNGE